MKVLCYNVTGESEMTKLEIIDAQIETETLASVSRLRQLRRRHYAEWQRQGGINTLLYILEFGWGIITCQPHTPNPADIPSSLG